MGIADANATIVRVAFVQAVPVDLVLGSDRQPISSETTLLRANAWTVCLATAIGDERLPLELHSTYHGCPGTRTRALHLLCGPARGRAESAADSHEHDALPVWHSQERLLFDHLLKLIEFSTRVGAMLAVGDTTSAVTAIQALPVE